MAEIKSDAQDMTVSNIYLIYQTGYEVNVDFIFVGICSHRKAVEYFIDSLTSFAFVGTNSQFKTHAVFGRGLNDRTPAGDYNFRTNLVSPFGRA